MQRWVSKLVYCNLIIYVDLCIGTLYKVLNISKPIIYVYLCIGGIGGTLYKVLNISKPITKSIHAILMILAAGI